MSTTMEKTPTTGPSTAHKKQAEHNDTTLQQIVSFKIGNEEYGVDIMRVQEIILMGAITKMPEAPAFIKGLINLRGNVISVTDLRTRFGLESKQADDRTRIIVMNLGERTVGVVVDEVNEVLRISKSQIEPAPSSISGIDHTSIKGLAKLNERILILLDVEQVLRESAQVADTVGA